MIGLSVALGVGVGVGVGDVVVGVGVGDGLGDDDVGDGVGDGDGEAASRRTSAAFSIATSRSEETLPRRCCRRASAFRSATATRSAA